MICPSYPPPQFLLYTDQIPPLIYYSHFSAIIVLIVGLFVYFKNRQSLESKLLLFISIIFMLWSLSDLVLWTNNNSDVIMFFWSFLGIFAALIPVLCLYFVYVFLYKKDLSFRLKLLLGSFLLPIVLLTPTNFNLAGFDLNLCGAAGFEGKFFIYYKLFLGLLMFCWIMVLSIKKYREADAGFRKQILLLIGGVGLFLFSFFTSTFLASYLTDKGIIDNFEIEQYGFFAMTFFMGVLAYMIVRFQAFNIKLLATQALIVSIIILVGSQFFFIRTFTNQVLTGITLFLSCIGGYLLVRSVKKEVAQREELARLNINLQNLIKQRESLVHLITHKVKGSFTRSKYIFAEILEGTFGQVSPKMKNIVEQGLNSDNEGIATVDTVLNSANLQSGKIKYDMRPINFRKIVEEIIDVKKGPAKTKGLRLRTDIKDGNYMVSGDAFWLKEAILNLVDNSVKYTLAGSIKIKLRRLDDKVFFSIKDTGVGITDEDQKHLFEEGGRGKDSVRINVDSTGYGLFTVKLVIEAHQGKIWEKSEGKDKGSKFYIELPGQG